MFVFGVMRLSGGGGGYINFFTGMFLQVLYLPSTSVVKTEDLAEGFLGSFF